jgi:pimeloyl-ACP methyl ester carboxylesterase
MGQVMWRWMGERDVLDAIDDAKRHYDVDADRVTLNGLSNGGVGAYSIGARHAWRFASVLPMAGAPSWLQYHRGSARPTERTLMEQWSSMAMIDNFRNTKHRCARIHAPYASTSGRSFSRAAPASPISTSRSSQSLYPAELERLLGDVLAVWNPYLEEVDGVRFQRELGSEAILRPDEPDFVHGSARLGDMELEWEGVRHRARDAEQDAQARQGRGEHPEVGEVVAAEAR